MVEWEILTNPVFSLKPLCSVEKTSLAAHSVQTGLEVGTLILDVLGVAVPRTRFDELIKSIGIPLGSTSRSSISNLQIFRSFMVNQFSAAECA